MFNGFVPALLKYISENMVSKIIQIGVANVLILLAMDVSKAYTSCFFYHPDRPYFCANPKLFLHVRRRF